MKISDSDLTRWKANTLAMAEEMGYDSNILNGLDTTKTTVLPGFSGGNFYGWAINNPPEVEVYERNPSIFLPKRLREIWNQSGMDHELMGHIYNGHAKLSYDEPAARKTQVEIAKYRGQNDGMWKMAARMEPVIRGVQGYGKKLIYSGYRTSSFLRKIKNYRKLF
ncbi:MAG: hypothetical protein JW716_03760 [Candidatus Aenigmarchaeota archaeon]|nr:hypothetical protein [Candidatus Aenigmarchaeota archaeon]